MTMTPEVAAAEIQRLTGLPTLSGAQFRSVGGGILLHAVFSALYYDFVVPAVETGSVVPGDVTAFLELCASSGDADVVNALEVSCLEDAVRGRPKSAPFLNALGAQCRSIALDIAARFDTDIAGGHE